MERPPPDQLYEPLPRTDHMTVEVGGKVYACSGFAAFGPGRYHSPSVIEVFDPETGLWHQQPTTGEIPPAVSSCAYATIGSNLYIFGGAHGRSAYNTLHELDLSTMVWRKVRPRNPSDGPQRKSLSGMVAYGDHSLVVSGGLIGDGNCTDELHVFNLKEGTWSSPRASGTPPPPCRSFSLTKTDEHHAVMFGGGVSGRGVVNDVYLLDMQNWHWTQVTTSGPSSPDSRESHAACCIAGPLLGSLSPQLFVTGGLDYRGGSVTSVTVDAWVLDLQSRTWMKVDVPDSVSRRFSHTLTVVSSGPASVQLVEFGGQRELLGHPIASTTVLQLTRDTTTRAQQVVMGTERRATEAERRATEAERRATEAERRATEAERRATEAERQFQQEQQFWMVRREEVELTDEILGEGGWGAVKAANFRGARVAAKCLHRIIASPYNRQLFMRELTMAARLRHPNLLQFIGATLEGELIILTELMPTSLRAELERGIPLPHHQIISISLDVARALNYLHLMRPSSIIHRDLSSVNVLMEPKHENSWKAKVSDYGTMNLLQKVRTVMPGSIIYAAPESNDPSQQSPKMDIFSFGVLLVETCTATFPDLPDRERLIQSIADHRMVDLIRECVAEDRDNRPSATEIIARLSEIQP